MPAGRVNGAWHHAGNEGPVVNCVRVGEVNVQHPLGKNKLPAVEWGVNDQRGVKRRRELAGRNVWNARPR